MDKSTLVLILACENLSYLSCAVYTVLSVLPSNPSSTSLRLVVVGFDQLDCQGTHLLRVCSASLISRGPQTYRFRVSDVKLFFQTRRFSRRPPNPHLLSSRARRRGLQTYSFAIPQVKLFFISELYRNVSRSVAAAVSTCGCRETKDAVSIGLLSGVKELSFSLPAFVGGAANIEPSDPLMQAFFAISTVSRCITSLGGLVSRRPPALLRRQIMTQK